jgi:hypothetical protein
MGAKQKAKGNRYERRVVKLLIEVTGVPFRKVPASGGFNKQGPQKVAEHVFSGDVICDDKNFAFSVEAKNQKAFSFTAILKDPKTAKFTEWWEQCVGDAMAIDKLPMLVFKPNTQDDFVALDDAGTVRLGLIDTPHFRLDVYNHLPTPNIFRWQTFAKVVDVEKLFDGMLRQE